MKRMEVFEKQIGDYTFYIKPFAAFTAANISGDVAALVAPMIGALSPLTRGTDGGQDASSILDADVEDVLPSLSNAFSRLSGDQFERLMKKLLIDNKNVSVEGEATCGRAMLMDYDLANEVFCCEVQDMYLLCWEVLKLNFRGFFKKAGALFGGLQGSIQAVAPTLSTGANSTQANSAT